MAKQNKRVVSIALPHKTRLKNLTVISKPWNTLTLAPTLGWRSRSLLSQLTTLGAAARQVDYQRPSLNLSLGLDQEVKVKYNSRHSALCRCWSTSSGLSAVEARPHSNHYSARQTFGHLAMWPWQTVGPLVLGRPLALRDRGEKCARAAGSSACLMWRHTECR